MRGISSCNNIPKLLFSIVAAAALFIGTGARGADYRQSFNKAKELFNNKFYQSALTEFNTIA